MLNPSYQTTQGFTMIELVMVIVLIGILAAAALPRFANMSTQAAIASNQATAGALRAAVGIAHATWIASGAATTGVTVTLEGAGVSINANGWPDAGMGTNNSTDLKCIDVFTALLNNTMPTVANWDTSGIAALTQTPSYSVTSNGGGTNPCVYIMYRGPVIVSPSRTITYNIATGVVTTT